MSLAESTPRPSAKSSEKAFVGPRKTSSAARRATRTAETPHAPTPKAADLQVRVRTGRIEFSSDTLFADPHGAFARRFFERAFLVADVASVEIDATRGRARLFLKGGRDADSALLVEVSELLSGKKRSVASLALPESFAHSDARVVRLSRQGERLSGWSVRHDIEGRVRLFNPALRRRAEVRQAIERELMNAFGVERYVANELTATVLIHYDPRQIQKRQLIALLDEALEKAKDAPKSPLDLDLPLCSASFGLAAASTFLAPALSPFAAALFLYTTIPSFKNAYQVLFKEKRLGVDVLDAIVVVMCLGTGQIFAGSVLGLTLGVARKLVKKTEDDSRRMLLNVFGKQPRFAFVVVDGVEVETPLEKIRVDDVIAIHTGETVPVDGEVVDGMAMIDQHTLTGESAPVEKIVGDKVLASTTLIAGKLRVRVTSAGDETTSAKLARILNDTAGYKMSSQSQGEAMADKAVLPTLALGALGLATRGINSAVAIVNCDLGTGIRVAAPIGMLTSLTLCAQHGILVKDGRALEAMKDVDTFLFDKTGTLTRERPEVGRILTFDGHSETEILQWAAAAENRFSHPIAKAILDRFHALGLPMPETDESQYHVGYGITVAIGGRKIRVGSARFMKHEGVRLPEAIEREMERVHKEGDSLIMVGVDDRLGGALEMRAADRPEALDVIAGLRARGAKHLAIISGDHEQPTRRLAEKLGMDRHFAEVLPQDKAKYVELLQKEGRKVCFIGDGVNDSIALKTANVSISLRGASSIATDTAQVVFMEESLTKLLDLRDVSIGLHRNVNRSWGLIIVPNLICIGGAFFGGFGVMHSMVFNQIGGMLALGNGLLPLREVAKARSEKEKLAEFIAEHASA